MPTLHSPFRRPRRPAATTDADPQAVGKRSRAAEAGQVIVIFAGGIVLFMLLLAVVVDVSWYWANNLRVQRAADAAALAGAVYLPGDRVAAYSKARAEAAKNGYVDLSGGVIVTPAQDAVNNRQLNVRVTAPVGTFFMRVIGITSIQASRTSKAEYVLPVPMGSPQNYYGVGFFQGVNPATSTTVHADRDSDWQVATNAPPGGEWFFLPDPQSNIVDAVRNVDSNRALVDGDGQKQSWGGFGLAGAIPAPAANQSLDIQGLEVRLQNTYLAQDCPNSTNKIRAELSWNGGTSWSSLVDTPNLGRDNAADYVLPATGGDTGTNAWGGHNWVRDDFSDANFQVRLTALKGCTAPAPRLRVDMLDVKVYYRLTTTTTTPEGLEVRSVPDPAGGTLDSQGFWGAIFTSGGVRENGDRYAPLYIGGGNPPDGTIDGRNPDYDLNGYDYTIEVGGNGEVRLFDPIFCATGASPSGGWFGAGDHWTTDGTGGGDAPGPVAVRYRLYNTNGTPYTITDDTQVGSDLAYDPGTKTLGDFSGQYSRASSLPQNRNDPNREDCSTNPAHNQWVLPSGWSGLPAGKYRVNVNTNLAGNATIGAENLFSIWVGASGRARVYGGGRMAAYTNLDDTGVGGAQKFYFAQIEQVHAGKTMVITLFDPGEASSNSYLRFLSPQGGSYHYATFNWSSNDGRSGSNVTQLQTSNGSALFNNKIVTIEVALPSNYAAGGLDPNGLGEDGWWQVEYDVRAGNDTTTWEVNIRGNPVHLKVP